MSHWEHSVSELTSFRNTSVYNFVFLPFPSHALGKHISHSLTSVSQLQFTSHSGSWLLKSIETTLILKPRSLFLVRSSESTSASFTVWGYGNSPSPWNYSFRASLTATVLFWSSSRVSTLFLKPDFRLPLFHKCWYCTSSIQTHYFPIANFHSGELFHSCGFADKAVFWCFGRFFSYPTNTYVQVLDRLLHLRAPKAP